jgi:Leucine-rich repeat (LRR) protein
MRSNHHHSHHHRAPGLVLAAAALALALGGGLAAPASTPAQAATNVVPDVLFRQCLNGPNYFNQDPLDHDITSTQLQNLTNWSQTWMVDCSGMAIESIEGAQYLKSTITSFTLTKHQVTDISPLANLTSLKTIDIQQGPLANLEPLAGLTNLVSLNLQDSKVTDLGPLEGLTKLQNLHLENTWAAGDNGNGVSDIGYLAGLTDLKVLGLANQDAYLQDHPDGPANQVQNITALTNLTALTTLDVTNNQVNDLSALAGLTNVTTLYMDHNQISDLSALQNLTNLTLLNARYNQITNLTGLEGATSAKTVYLASNQITNLDPLAGLTHLTTLDVSHNQIEDVEPLKDLTTLTGLTLSDNPVSNLTPLAGLTNLTSLKAYGMQVSDVSPLASLTALTTLALNQNQIKDASPLTKAVLTNLEDGSSGLSLNGQTITVDLTADTTDTITPYTVASLGLKPRDDTKTITLSTEAPGDGQVCADTTVPEVQVPNTKGPHTFYFCSDDQFFSGAVTVNITRPAIVGQKPTIDGTAQVGQKLTAQPGAWTPAPVDFTYQWLRNGTAIKGATGVTYLVADADLGATLSVAVTGSKAERDSVTETSDPTPAVTPGDAPAGRYESLALTPDLTGDGKGELLAIQGSDGALHMYASKGDGTLQGAKVLVASGLKGARVFGPGDWNGDQKADVITVDTAGTMWLYKGNGAGGIGAKVKIGSGWATHRIIPVGDLNRDGADDLLAIDAEGKLWLYGGNGQGGFVAGRTRVGQGWVGFDLYSAADLNKDGKVDILSVNTAGKLYAYLGRGDGHFEMPVQVGQGWDGFTLAAGGDLNGDGLADIVGRNDKTGTLYYYRSKGAGKFAHSQVAATGW